MTKDEALTLALETLKSGVKTQANRIAWIEYDSCLIKEAITAIKEALAQPERKFDPNDSFARDEAAAARVREFMRNH